jgi:hypothetical protein
MYILSHVRESQCVTDDFLLLTLGLHSRNLQRKRNSVEQGVLRKEGNEEILSNVDLFSGIF